MNTEILSYVFTPTLFFGSVWVHVMRVVVNSNYKRKSKTKALSHYATTDCQPRYFAQLQDGIMYMAYFLNNECQRFKANEDNYAMNVKLEILQ